jgi:hypothetical protein
MQSRSIGLSETVQYASRAVPLRSAARGTTAATRVFWRRNSIDEAVGDEARLDQSRFDQNSVDEVASRQSVY